MSHLKLAFTFYRLMEGITYKVSGIAITASPLCNKLPLIELLSHDVFHYKDLRSSESDYFLLL